MSKKWFVYVIGLEEDFDGKYNNCYIGVTVDPARRWKNHEKSNFTVGRFIRTFELTYEKNMIILFSGTDKECFDLEAKMRPVAFIGLNEASGGKGGYTVYTEERNNKISKALTGKSKTEEHIQKIMSTREKLKTHSGKRNPSAKKWRFTSPTDETFIVEGTFQQFCNEHKLLASCLRYYKGKNVPYLETNKYGGYRKKSDVSFELRSNTSGWKLEEVTE